MFAPRPTSSKGVHAHDYKLPTFPIIRATFTTCCFQRQWNAYKRGHSIPLIPSCKPITKLQYPTTSKSHFRKPLFPNLGGHLLLWGKVRGQWGVALEDVATQPFDQSLNQIFWALVSVMYFVVIFWNNLWFRLFLGRWPCGLFYSVNWIL